MAQHTITITGNIIADPVVRTVGENTLFRMRVASSRAIREGEDWKNVDKLYISVECWGRLARNCRASLFRGLPVIVTGTLITHEWEDSENAKQSRIVLRANHIGIDLIRHQTQAMVLQQVVPPTSADAQGATDGAGESQEIADATPQDEPAVDEVAEGAPADEVSAEDAQDRDLVEVGAQTEREGEPPF